jgi:hypothetical protein
MGRGIRSLSSCLSIRESNSALAELLAALDAFLQEHRRCGELDGGIDETDAEADEREARERAKMEEKESAEETGGPSVLTE